MDDGVCPSFPAITEATVKTRVSAIINKLDCTDRVGMVAWGLRNNVVD